MKSIFGRCEVREGEGRGGREKSAGDNRDGCFGLALHDDADGIALSKV